MTNNIRIGSARMVIDYRGHFIYLDNPCSSDNVVYGKIVYFGSLFTKEHRSVGDGWYLNFFNNYCVSNFDFRIDDCI